jgi:AcrR family transcriptional regulator
VLFMAEDVRKHIVDTAIRLLESEGPKAFGQTRVAREAKVQQGHLTYYFPRKADLVAAVHERFTEAARQEFARVMARAAHLDAAELRSLFFAHARTTMKDRRRTRVLITLLIESQEDPEVAQVLEERGAGQRAMAAMLLGRTPDDLDVDIVMGALQGIGLQHLIRRVDTRRIDDIVARLQDWIEALPPRTSA